MIWRTSGLRPAPQTEIAAPRSRRGEDLRDPESGDAALTDRIAREQGADPASANLGAATLAYAQEGAQHFIDDLKKQLAERK